jgi:hypothetical protein
MPTAWISLFRISALSVVFSKWKTTSHRISQKRSFFLYVLISFSLFVIAFYFMCALLCLVAVLYRLGVFEVLFGCVNIRGELPYAPLGGLRGVLTIQLFPSVVPPFLAVCLAVCYMGRAVRGLHSSPAHCTIV